MPTEASQYPLCRHLKTNGLRCQSPALTGQFFCYFHNRLHAEHPVPLTARQIVDAWHEGMAESIANAGEDPMQIARAYPHQNEFPFPPLEDAESIQYAASMLFHVIAQGHIHLRRGRMLLHALQIASSSLRIRQATRVAESDVAPIPVRHFDQLPTGVAIAPAEPVEIPQPEPNQDFADNPAT